MSLMLAPYNEAMRIGMGFNSYTQTLCIDDVVRRADGSKASEEALKPKNPSSGVPGTVVKTLVDGQAEVSQVVSYSAGFVNKVSELNHSLNISGALSITVDALNASASASAHYLSEQASKDSDIRYSIIVKVTNQKLVADDVTQFSPIDNVPASKFQEVYGDCFISGFLEGGILNGLISKRLLTGRDNTEIGGELSVAMKLSVVNVSGSAKGDYKDLKVNDNSETQVTVTWSGGGDIKPNSVLDWDIPNLTKVAVEFPDRVALCPQRTYAILTKYTALRSYHEKTVKGSPMDYEIAGIYTNSLLDSYMEYKNIWADISSLIKQISENRLYVKKKAEITNAVTEDKKQKETSEEKVYVKKREETPELIKYREEPEKDYKARMVRFDAAKAALEKSGTLSQVTLEEPLPANECKPYDADDFGLDKAQRDCRFEMIKIVREVNDVTWNPKVATDPNRKWRYLSPAIFRLLVPTDKAVMPSIEQIEKWRADLLAEVQKNKELTAKQQATDAAVEAATKGLSEKLTLAEKDRNAYLEEKNKTAGSLDQKNKDYTELLKTMDSRNELAIIRVEYGGKSFRNDLTLMAKLTRNIRETSSIIINTEYFSGQDPTPGIKKHALIAYKWKDRMLVTLESPEGSTVELRKGESEDFDIGFHEIASKK